MSTISGSLLFLLSSLSIPGCRLILVLSLLLLLGVAPFHFWSLKVLPSLDFISLCLFLGPLKTGYLFQLLSLDQTLLLFLLPSLFLGLALYYLCPSLYALLFASSSCTLFVIGLLGPTLGIFYYIIYLVAIFVLLCTAFNLCSALLSILILAGFPPFTMFWAKLSALLLCPRLTGCLVLAVSAYGLYPYLGCGITMILNNAGVFSSVFFLTLTQLFSFSFFLILVS